MAENETNKEAANEAQEQPTVESLMAEIERLKDANGKLRGAQSNASAQASAYKKQLQERMSEQERASAEAKELMEQLKAENAELKRNQTLAEYKAGFLGLGYSDDLAKSAAAAILDGKFSDFLTTHKQFVTDHDKALTADAIRNMARPGAGGSDTSVTKEQFAKMNYADRVKLYNEQPELYKKLNE